MRDSKFAAEIWRKDANMALFTGLKINTIKPSAFFKRIIHPNGAPKNLLTGEPPQGAFLKKIPCDVIENFLVIDPFGVLF